MCPFTSFLITTPALNYKISPKKSNMRAKKPPNTSEALESIVFMEYHTLFGQLAKEYTE